MGYALYGNEIDDTITPLEAGLGWIVKLDKGSPFTGDHALKVQKLRGVSRKLVAFSSRAADFPATATRCTTGAARWTSCAAAP